LLWRLACGESLDGNGRRARAGLRWVHMRTDLPAAVTLRRRGLLSANAYVRSLRGPLEFAILAADDPVPAMLDLPLLALLAWRRSRG
jgi:predicted ATP-grasp superfamily ATP-dependent carboligase